MEIRYPGMVDEGKLTQTPLGRALERQRTEIAPKKFTNLTKAKVQQQLPPTRPACPYLPDPLTAPPPFLRADYKNLQRVRS
jgi:hypothetical protein